MINNDKLRLDPYWVTGFTDAEGCFYILYTKSKGYKTGWRVQACFQIGLHIRDIELLRKIKLFFNNVGCINELNNNIVVYQIRDVKDLTNVVIPHFEKFPLFTNKEKDFLIWKDIVILINKKEHLNEKGLMKIINLKTFLNKGLSKELLVYYSNLVKKDKYETILVNYDINNNWLSGFFSGDGNFHISLKKKANNYYPELIVSLAQHNRNKLLLNSLINFLECGKLEYYSNNNMRFVIYKFSNIYDKIIPLFKEYPIQGIKFLDFQDFCQAAELIKKKSHLTSNGLEQVRTIKARMNLARYKK